MCGIAGVWKASPIADREALADRLDRALAHRGPDGAGRLVEDDERLLFVHRRLAIIDLSDAGRQPMWSSDGRRAIVFNGEIYNYRELRRSLESDGVRLRTNSDTEVILALVGQRGPAALNQLRGMFAFACWDRRDRTLLVARDRFGIKPLYIAERPGQMAFASEMHALSSSGLVPHRIDPAGVHAFLRWGAVPPPLTWLSGVTALDPGTWRVWRADGQASSGRFADVRDLWTGAADRTRSREDVIEHGRQALADSVGAHLVADVPVGAFLSGGLDSAALAATASKLLDRQLNTYTVTFDEAELSEEAPAARIAAICGTSHHTLRLSGTRVAGEWPELLTHLDSPTFDGVNTYYVSKAVAATGVKAVLSGVGGDELFGGYPSFRRLPRALGLARALSPALAAAGHLAALAQPRRMSARWRQVARSEGQPIELYRALRGFCMPDEIDEIAGPRLLDDPSARQRIDDAERDRLLPVGPESAAATTARLETTGYMMPLLLRDVDAVSMAHSLEVRVPFVDHCLVGALWPGLGAHPDLLRRKHLLAEILAPALPRDVLARRKQPFALPFAAWLSGPLREIVRGGLSTLEDDGWIRPGAAGASWSAWERRETHWSRPWGLAVLGWMLAPRKVVA